MKNIIVGIIVILLIIGGYKYFISPQSSLSLLPNSATTTPDTATTADASDTIKPTAAQPTTAPAKNTFKSIFAQAGNHQCTYEQVSSSGQSNNVIYIADGKMRGEFRTLSGENTTATIMIYSGGYLYTWTEGLTTGTKTTINTIADLPAVIPHDLTSAAVIGTGMNSVGWNCRDWLKDNSLLTPPSYVKFK